MKIKRFGLKKTVPNLKCKVIASVNVEKKTINGMVLFFPESVKKTNKMLIVQEKFVDFKHYYSETPRGKPRGILCAAFTFREASGSAAKALAGGLYGFVCSS